MKKNLKQFITGYKTIDKLKSNTTLSVTFASGCCMCFKRKTIEDIGLLDESFFLYEEDAEYCLRMKRMGKAIIYNPKAIIYHKVNASAGKIAGMSSYYLMRNKLRLIKMYSKGINKFYADVYNVIRYIYLVIKGKLNFRVLISAIISYFMGEEGRTKKFN